MPRPTLCLAALAAAVLGPLAAFSVHAQPADPRLAGYRTPPGWKVEIAATEPLVINPVTMTWGPDGRLYVIEWQAGRGPNDHIKVLTDENGDGVFDKSSIYMDHLELPAGLCFWDGWTYVTLDHDVVRLKDADGDGQFETRQVVASGFGNDDSHHRVSGMVIGPDGWLYLTTGDSDARARGSDGSTATVLRSGGVFRCKPDGAQLEVVALGMRNPWGNVAFDDEFHIFHTDNDNEGTPGFTGCRLLHIVEGGDYGWRLREGARCCAPDFERATWNGGRPGRLGWIAETGRGAPAGLCVLNSAAFPASARNLLVYPDVFRKLVRGYKLRPAGATYAVAEELELLASDEGLFRPTDAEVGPDGALYILDWRTDSGGAGQLSGNGQTGRIYRMTWSGTAAEPARPTFPPDRFVKLRKGTDDNLLQALGSDDYPTRREASHEILHRLKARLSEMDELARQKPGDPRRSRELAREYGRLEDALVEICMDIPRLMGQPSQTPAHARRHALGIFHALHGRLQDGRSNLWSVWQSAIGDPDPAVRRYGFEGIARLAFPDEPKLAATVAMALATSSDRDPQQLRAMALALGRFSAIRRARPGETVDWPAIAAPYREAHAGLEAVSEAKAFDAGKAQEALDAINKAATAFADQVSADLLADGLLDLAARSPSADVFRRDGCIRGLERLGPAGQDAVVKALAAKDPKRSAAALEALQGWRSTDGVAAVLAAATGAQPIPAAARANLFRTLRELIDAVPADRIAEWLERTPAADPEPRVEAIHVLTAMGKRAVLAAGPALPRLLADDRPEVRRAALGLAANVRSAEIKAVLVQMVGANDRPLDERRLALGALRSYEDRMLVPLLGRLFEQTENGAFRSEVLRVLAPLDARAAAELARSALGSPDRELRHEAIALLGQKPETALIVANLYNAGKLPAEDLPRVLEAVRAHATPELQAATQSLLKNRLLAAPTGAEAERLREYVRRHGSAERGKAVYLDPKKGGCTTCHRMEGVGGSVGPELTRIWETLSFDKRLEAILDPSKEIKEGFTTFKVATTAGRVVTGLLLADTPEAITLKDAEGREVRIPAREVEEKRADKESLMPAGVVGHLSLAELADLLAFLGDRKAQESLRTQAKAGAH